MKIFRLFKSQFCWAESGNCDLCITYNIPFMFQVSSTFSGFFDIIFYTLFSPTWKWTLSLPHFCLHFFFQREKEHGKIACFWFVGALHNKMLTNVYVLQNVGPFLNINVKHLAYYDSMHLWTKWYTSDS